MNFPLPTTDPLGTDIQLGTNGDILPSMSGSLLTVSDVDNVSQSVRTNITTLPASYLWGSTVGTDLAKYVDEPITSRVEQLIKTTIQSKLDQDKRVTKVENITFDTSVNNALIITIYATVQALGVVQIPIVIGGV